MARISWAPAALDDLDAVLTYIAKDAPLAAVRFAEKLMARIDLLAQHPLMGGYIREDQSHTYRETIQGNYRVIYRVEGRTVYIVTVHHAARLLDADDLD
ncbi:MAG TPA: type II toxin-antitoxin system RelE/ParE family toxin [Thermoguttaceae bacterium]|nr:type II toxin-antitoxin system RelE/ParE family toxin [Thermoguttaceae bacterium]